MNELDSLYEEMKSCSACKLRAGCSQVVTSIGQTSAPILLAIGEAPGGDEDAEGVPFVGRAGRVLREALRETGILNKGNTLVTNVLHCRPPKNKFPTDESPSICVGRWLSREIELAAPQRMLLLGAKPLFYVAGLSGIKANRGRWMNVRGIRTMATYHPSYVLRSEREGKMDARRAFEDDIGEVAGEVGYVLNEALGDV